MSSEIPEVYNCGNPECSRSRGAGLLVAEYKGYPPPGTPEDQIHRVMSGTRFSIHCSNCGHWTVVG